MNELTMETLNMAFWMMVIGSLLLLAGGTPVLAAVKSKRWPVVSGTITESRRIARQTRRKFLGMWVYVPVVEYSYSVNNHAYHGKRICFGESYTNVESVSDALLKRYPKGKKIDIYYSIRDPKESVLEPGFKIERYILHLVFVFSGLCFLSFAGMVAIQAIRINL